MTWFSSSSKGTYTCFKYENLCHYEQRLERLEENGKVGGDESFSLGIPRFRHVPPPAVGSSLEAPLLLRFLLCFSLENGIIQAPRTILERKPQKEQGAESLKGEKQSVIRVALATQLHHVRHATLQTSSYKKPRTERKQGIYLSVIHSIHKSISRAQTQKQEPPFSWTLELVFEPEIEKLARRNRRETRLRKAQQEQEILQGTSEENLVHRSVMEEHPLNKRITSGEYVVPNSAGCSASIVRPPIAANNFEIKPALLHLVQQDQFGGSEVEDPNLHLSSFLQICDTIKMNGVSDEVIRLRLFPFSLRDRAKYWLQTQLRGSITTWEELVSKLLMKYFPPSKYYKLRGEISCFGQKEGESLCKAWEQFKKLLRNCPHHGFSDVHQVHIFYN
ncbi:hypothetical protein VNO77_30889 [Canavalia gladiata]|uniref:Retrotransposon gag domain-containing protein n=1 Tax=Canavalia gladiata TaxID=3824 RepID=A0AAN9Q1K1_CANGL